MTPLEDALIRPGQVWRYYEETLEALRNFQHFLIGGGAIVRTSRFVGMASADVLDELKSMRSELDDQVTLALVAGFEGILRVDARQRIELRLKDPVSLGFRRLEKKSLPRASFERVDLSRLIGIWRNQSSTGVKDFAEFDKLMLFRHWLAHGRYWTLKIGPPPHPFTTRQIAERVFARFPKFKPPSFVKAIPSRNRSHARFAHAAR